MTKRVLLCWLTACALTLAQGTGQNSYIQHNLVSDLPGMADFTDPNLVDPWGVSESATSPFWVSNHLKGNTTLYNGSGAILPVVVTIPPGAGGATPSKPTGQVSTNGSRNWFLANGNPASFIFSTEDGTISAWNGGTVATVMVDNSASGAVYKGLTINTTGATPMLYAANFSAGKVDVFDAKFAPTQVPGGFTDPNLPADFAPFGIVNLNGSIYVTYAKQDATKKNDVFGAGNGFVDVFDLNGTLQNRLVSNGPLNSPWGVAIAPPAFGAFGGAVLVGNFGDGKINAFDAKTGTLLGTLQDQSGNPIVITGLWALLFGNGRTGGDNNTLYFAAGITGPDSKTHGLFGSLAPPSAVLSVFNAASELGGPIAPGEVVTVNGLTIGPSPSVTAPIPSSGTVSTAFGGTSIYFNGISAPVLFTSASQTSVVVPYAVAGTGSATVAAIYKGQVSAQITVPVADSAPGLFTLNFSGTGGVVALNSDGTVNGATNGAAKGSVVVLFATGEGLVNPLPADGAITGRVLSTPKLPVSLTIDGQPALVLYDGSAPGNVAGVLQIEAIVPATASVGSVPVVLKVGSASSQPGATLAVK